MGIGAGAVAGSVAAGVLGSLGTLFARGVVTPAREPVEDIDVLGTHQGADGLEVELRVDEESVKPGQYSLWFDHDRGHARLGEITWREGGRLRRRVLQVDSGDLSAARRGRLGGNVYLTPGDLDLPYEDVQVPVSAGRAPAWLVPGGERADTWAILIHGRGARRTETLRGLRPLHALGLTALSVSYRNDGDAPDVNNGRYGLGTTEWRDIDSAITYAVEHGARDIVLVGWSMGGSIALQVADRSQHRTRIQALVLDGPAVNWFDILDHQAKLNRLPWVSGRFGTWLLTHPWGKRITGLTSPLDLHAMDWVARADEVRVPTLILHSVDDDFVPFGSSQALAEANPRMVDLIRFDTAGHVREWNLDPQRWEDAVAEWLGRELTSPPLRVASR